MAWDSRGIERVSGVNRLADRVGTNHLLNVGWKSRTQNFLSVAGTNNLMQFTSAVTLPVNYVVASFLRVGQANTFFVSEFSTSAYWMLERASTNLIAGGPNGSTAVSFPTFTDDDAFTAMAVTPSGGRYFARTTLHATVAPTNRFGTVLRGIGWSANGNTNNLKTTDHFYAAGIWAGTADAVQLQAIGDQARAYVTEPLYSRAHSTQRFARPNNLAALAAGFQRRVSSVTASRMRTIFVGRLTIQGTVIEDGLPACKEVRVYERRTHICRGSTWSDPVTGHYAFDKLDEKIPYYVLSFDDKGARPAQIRDRIVASG